MKQYQDFLRTVLEEGRTSADRSGFWIRSIFGYTARYNLQEGFPLITTKKMPKKVWIHELLWFLSGRSDNIRELQAHDVHIWDGFADENGDLGPMYGYQWRKWPKHDGSSVDQLKRVIKLLKTDPYSKALVVSAWNAGQLEEMRLPPCHTLFQFHARKDELSLILYQRSCDAFIGAPFNIAQYSLLLMMVAQVTGFKPFEFIHMIGDAHIYKNHKEIVLEQLSRKPYPLPTMKINPEIKDIDSFKIDDFKIKHYKHHEKIPTPVVIV